MPVDDIVLMPMANYGLKLYGNAIIVNPKFAAEKPEAVKAFLHAFLKGLKETIRHPAEAVESIAKRDDAAKQEVELERLRMAIRDNIVTPGGASRRLRRGRRRRGWKNRSSRSGWSTPSRPSPSRRISSTPRSCRRRPSAGQLSAASGYAAMRPRRARAGAWDPRNLRSGSAGPGGCRRRQTGRSVRSVGR